MTGVQTPIYLEGRQAAIEGKIWADCPYQGADRREWQRGYNVGRMKIKRARIKQEKRNGTSD